MFTIYKLIDGVETEVRCTTQEGAEAMLIQTRINTVLKSELMRMLLLKMILNCSKK